MQACETLSVSEAAQALGVGLHSLYDAVRDGRVPALRVGRKPKFRIPRRVVERLLENPASFSPVNEKENNREVHG